MSPYRKGGGGGVERGCKGKSRLKYKRERGIGREEEVWI